MMPPVAIEDIEHGTNRGYEQERTRKIPTCAKCRAAHSAKVRASRLKRIEEVGTDRTAKVRRANRLRYGRVQVPLDLFVQLWYTADKPTLDAMDKYFGKTQVDEWIKKNEEAQGASND